MKKVLFGFTLTVLILLGALTLLLPKKDFSEEENRILAEKPALSAKTLFDGTYATKTTDYLSDHFAGRLQFMKLYAYTEKALQKTDYNGVLVCKHNFLIEKPVKKENTEEIIKALKSVSDKTTANCYLMLVPTAITLYPEVLPKGAGELNDQLEAAEEIYARAGMTNVPVYDALVANKERMLLYYKTDHHWTTDAAYLAYREYCDKAGFTPQEKEDFEIKEVSNKFYGTVYSKALIGARPDTIKAYLQLLDGVKVSAMMAEGKLYNEEYLDKKDKYSYFLDGINPQLLIENENVKNGKTLLVVKDSYANCFVPFLINHYEKIMVLDTRYYFAGVSNTAEALGADDILFLFNLNTLDTDSLINGIY